MTTVEKVRHFHLHHPGCFDDNDDCLGMDDIQNVGHHCHDHLYHHEHHKHHDHHDHYDHHQHHDDRYEKWRAATVLTSCFPS